MNNAAKLLLAHRKENRRLREENAKLRVGLKMYAGFAGYKEDAAVERTLARKSPNDPEPKMQSDPNWP